jgi:hypothetical protein
MKIPGSNQRKGKPTMSRLTKTIVAIAGTVALVFGISTAAFASLPAGTTVTGSLKSGTDMTFKGDIDSIPITVSCTKFSASGKVPKKKSDTVTLSKPPTINGCTDSSGGTDTITTSGTWTLTIAAKTLTLGIPKAGATFKSSILSSCTIIAEPSAAAGVKGKYNGKNTDTVTNAKIKTKGSGCTSTTATTTATVILSPAPGAPPW